MKVRLWRTNPFSGNLAYADLIINSELIPDIIKYDKEWFKFDGIIEGQAKYSEAVYYEA